LLSIRERYEKQVVPISEHSEEQFHLTMNSSDRDSSENKTKECNKPPLLNNFFPKGSPTVS
jgi:hypothetical protein